MFIVGIRKDHDIINIYHKIIEECIFKDLVHSSYNDRRSIAVTLLYDVTLVRTHVCEKGGVFLRGFFDSYVLVSIR